jgi:hypothetical protein
VHIAGGKRLIYRRRQARNLSQNLPKKIDGLPVKPQRQLQTPESKGKNDAAESEESQDRDGAQQNTGPNKFNEDENGETTATRLPSIWSN